MNEDYMQVGSVIPLSGGWFLDTESNRKFVYSDDGSPIFEDEMNNPEDYSSITLEDDEDRP